MRRTPAFLLLLVLAAPSTAHSGESFAVRPGAVVAGGGSSAGGHFGLEGSIGQTPIGESSGGPFRLSGGLWPTIGSQDRQDRSACAADDPRYMRKTPTLASGIGVCRHIASARPSASRVSGGSRIPSSQMRAVE